MDELVVDGERYISSKRAARLSGYAKDYIGQLCRAGKIDAKMVGRSWYIKESALKEHRKHFQGKPVIDEDLWVEGKDGVEFKGFGSAPEPQRPRLEEEHVKINYEADDRPLIPNVKEKPIATSPELSAATEDFIRAPLEKTSERDVEIERVVSLRSVAEEEVDVSETEVFEVPVTDDREFTPQEEDIEADEVHESVTRASQRPRRRVRPLFIMVLMALASVLFLIEERITYTAVVGAPGLLESRLAPLSVLSDIELPFAR